MDAETVASRIKEICNSLQEIAKTYGSQFQVSDNDYTSYVQRVGAIVQERGDKITLEDKQAHEISIITDEIISNMEKWYEQEIFKKNKSLQEVMEQVQEKIDFLTQGVMTNIQEKQILIAKYKILLKHKGPTEEIQLQLSKIEKIIDEQNKLLEQLKADQDEILRQMKDKQVELDLKIRENEIMDIQNADLIEKVRLLKEQQVQSTEDLRLAQEQLDQEKSKLEPILKELQKQLDQNKDLSQLGNDLQQEVQNLSTSVQTKQAEILQRQQEIQQTTQDILNYTNKIQQNQQIIGVLNANNQQQQLLSDAQQDLQDKQTTLNKLKQQHQQLEQQRQQAELDEDQVKQQLQQVNSEILTVEQDINDIKQKIQNLTNSITQLRAENTKLRTELAAKQSQNAKLSQQLINMQQQLQNEANQLKQVTEENTQLTNAIALLQGDLAVLLKDQQNAIQKMQQQINVEKQRNVDLNNERNKLINDIQKLNNDPVQIGNPQYILEKIKEDNKLIETSIKDIKQSLAKIEKESEQLENALITFKEEVNSFAKELKSFIQNSVKFHTPPELSQKIDQLQSQIYPATDVDSVIDIQQQLTNCADDLIIIGNTKRLSLTKIMDNMILKQKQLQDIKDTNIEERVAMDFSMFNVFMTAYRSNETHQYFEKVSLSGDQKVDMINQIITHHNDQTAQDIELMHSLYRTLLNIKYYELVLQTENPQSQEEYDTIKQLMKQGTILKESIEQHLTQQVVEFYNYISVFLVPLTVFRSRHTEVANMGERFFRAKIEKMKEHAKQLSALNIDTGRIREYIKMLEINIQAIQKQAQIAEQISQQTGLKGKSNAYNVVLHPDQNQDELQKATVAWYSAYNKQKIQSDPVSKKNAVYAMVDVVNKCSTLVKKLPVIKQLADMGVDICQEQKENARIGVTNLIKGIPLDWSGIPGYLISASPYTYELAQFIFLQVTEALLTDKGLENTFTSEYVDQLNRYLISKTVDDEGKTIDNAVRSEILKHYGAFLLSLENFFRQKTGNINTKKIDTVLAEVMNLVGKSRILNLGKKISLMQNAYNNIDQFNKLAAGLDKQIARQLGQNINPVKNVGNGPAKRYNAEIQQLAINIKGTGNSNNLSNISELIKTLKYTRYFTK